MSVNNIKTIYFLALVFFISTPFVLAGESVEKLNEKANPLRMGNALFMRGRISDAIALYQQAIQFSSTSLSSYLNLAIAFRTLGQNFKAREALESASKLSPQDAEIKTELGWLYFREGKFQESEKEFSEALKINSAETLALLGLGMTLLAQGQASLFPPSRNQHDATGGGQTKESVKIFQKAIAIQPNFSAIYFFLGKAYEELGDLRQAQENYVTAIRKDWTFAEARMDLARIYDKLAEEERAYRQYAALYKLDTSILEAKSAVEKFSEKYKEEPVAPAEVMPRFSTLTFIFSDKQEAKIRVGLWTSPSGNPPKLKSFKFASSGNFKVVGLKSKKVFAEGKEAEIWEAYSLRRGAWDLKSPDGKKLGPFAHGVAMHPYRDEQSFLVWGMEGVPSSWEKRELKNSMQIFPHRSGGIYLTNELYLEDYLAGVVPKEMPSEWPLEALKAQAIIARNQAILRKRISRPHRRYFYDLCDGQHCQVYGGVLAETEKVRRVVMETRGKLLYFKNTLASSYYHSNCGGATRSADAVWGLSKINYLAGKRDNEKEEKFHLDSPWELNRWIKSQPESFCRFNGLVSSTEYRWLRIVPAKFLERKLNRRYRIGKLKAVIPLKRDGAGHVVELLVSGTKRKTVLRKEHEIRHYLGLESLRSTLFLVETINEDKGKIKDLWFYGGGWGHGVGMCQTGAAGLAGQEKKSAEEILNFYFPGTEVR